MEICERTIGEAGASNCGDLSSKMRPRLKMTASTVSGVPSWNFTPCRSLKIHLVLVVLVDPPFRRKPGPDAGDAVEIFRELPIDQRVVGGDSRESGCLRRRCSECRRSSERRRTSSPRAACLPARAAEENVAAISAAERAASRLRMVCILVDPERVGRVPTSSASMQRPCQWIQNVQTPFLFAIPAVL